MDQCMKAVLETPGKEIDHKAARYCLRKWNLGSYPEVGTYNLGWVVMGPESEWAHLVQGIQPQRTLEHPQTSCLTAFVALLASGLEVRRSIQPGVRVLHRGGSRYPASRW